MRPFNARACEKFGSLDGFKGSARGRLRSACIGSDACHVRVAYVAAMDMVSVHSHHLAAIGYDASTCVLHIEFRDGHIYAYSNVPEMVHHKLMSVKSHGAHFSHFIHDKFPAVRIA